MLKVPSMPFFDKTNNFQVYNYNLNTFTIHSKMLNGDTDSVMIVVMLMIKW